MNICMISKFPPIQGGISAKTFWLAKGLAESGTTVHVVTNANFVEEDYYIDDQSPELSPDLRVHNVKPDIPWHIPYSELYVPRLLDKAMEVVDENQIDIIDANYLIPYGIVGYLLSNITGLPYVLRHGGSDIAKFLEQGIFSHLLTDVTRKAAAIITDDKNRTILETINSNVHVLPRYIPDERYFKPAMNSHDIPTFAYIGKTNYYWKHKSLDKIVEIFSGVKNPYALHFVGQGKGFTEFAKFVSEHDLKTHEFKKFIHPVHMPSLLGNIDYLLYFEKDNPIKDFSNILCEALWSGLTIITDQTMDISEYAQYTQGVPANQIIRLNLEDINVTQKEITALINQWSGPARFNVGIDYGYDRYIEKTLRIYDSM